MREILSFLKKDFLVETSYKISFIFNVFGVFMSLLVYYFIDKMYGVAMVKYLEEFGVSYFAYVLLSMAFFSYIGVGLGSFSDRLRVEQIQGTLEAILLTPVKIKIILLSLTLWNLILATVDLAIYIILGIFLFRIDFSNINVLSTIIILILTIISFSSLGIISASFIMVFKRGNPLGWVLNNIEGLIGGVYFPVAVLPGWLKFVANCLPITYSVRAIQLAVYKGYSLVQLSRELIFLFLFSLLLFPLGLIFFKYALNKARRKASLSQY